MALSTKVQTALSMKGHRKKAQRLMDRFNDNMHKIESDKRRMAELPVTFSYSRDGLITGFEINLPR